MRVKTFKFTDDQAIDQTYTETTINSWLASPGLSAPDLPLRVEKVETVYSTSYEKKLRRRGYYEYVPSSYVLKHVWYYTAGDVGMTVAATLQGNDALHPLYANVVNDALDPIGVEAKITNTVSEPVIVSVPGVVQIEPA